MLCSKQDIESLSKFKRDMSGVIKPLETNFY